jgi:uncharacterized protein (TIGR02118 family)
MIRFVYVVRRKEELSLVEFQSYWRNAHGPLVAKHSTTMRIRRYVQTHTLDDPINSAARERRGFQPPYDGVAELWWDNAEELAAAAEKPEYQSAADELLEDEKNFIDFSKSSIWFAYELPQVNPSPENILALEESPIIKICYFVNRLSDLSLEEAQMYWRVNHGPLIRSLAPALSIKRYIQVHRLVTPFDDGPKSARGGMEEPFMGQAELWYDRKDLLAAMATPEGVSARELAAEDEAKFIDFKRFTMWLAKEHVFIDRGRITF